MHVIFTFFITTSKQSSAEDILILSDSNPHFTIPSINATLQVEIGKIKAIKLSINRFIGLPLHLH